MDLRILALLGTASRKMQHQSQMHPCINESCTVLEYLDPYEKKSENNIVEQSGLIPG